MGQLEVKQGKHHLYCQQLRMLRVRMTQVGNELLEEQERQRDEHMAELAGLESEVSLLIKTPPAIDGHDDARRLKQTVQRPLTLLETRLQAKKRWTVGQVVLLFNRQLASTRLFELRALRQEIKQEWTRSCRDLENTIRRVREARSSERERQLQGEYTHIQREYERITLQSELLQTEIDDLLIP